MPRGKAGRAKKRKEKAKARVASRPVAKVMEKEREARIRREKGRTIPRRFAGRVAGLATTPRTVGESVRLNHQQPKHCLLQALFHDLAIYYDRQHGERRR